MAKKTAKSAYLPGGGGEGRRIGGGLGLLNNGGVAAYVLSIGNGVTLSLTNQQRIIL